MADYSKYRAAIISKAEYDTEGVGYSTVMEDFPFALGPAAFFDTLSGLARLWGRDPADNLPLIVTEVDRYKSTVTTNGVNSASDYASPTKDTIPAACIVIVQVSAASVLANIDAAVKHFVLGVDPQPLDGTEELPPALQPYAWDQPIPPARWTELRDGMVQLGVDATALDNWKINHPNATPEDFAKAFKNFIS